MTTATAATANNSQPLQTQPAFAQALASAHNLHPALLAHDQLLADTCATEDPTFRDEVSELLDILARRTVAAYLPLAFDPSRHVADREAEAEIDRLKQRLAAQEQALQQAEHAADLCAEQAAGWQMPNKLVQGLGLMGLLLAAVLAASAFSLLLHEAIAMAVKASYFGWLTQQFRDFSVAGKAVDAEALYVSRTLGAAIALAVTAAAVPGKGSEDFVKVDLACAAGLLVLRLTLVPEADLNRALGGDGTALVLIGAKVGAYFVLDFAVLFVFSTAAEGYGEQLGLFGARRTQCARLQQLLAAAQHKCVRLQQQCKATRAALLAEVTAIAERQQRLAQAGAAADAAAAEAVLAYLRGVQTLNAPLVPLGLAGDPRPAPQQRGKPGAHDNA